MAIQINGKKVIHLGSMTIPIIKGDVGPEGKQGKQGIPGIDGKDGITPLRGIDYWTTEDKTEIINEIDNKVQNDLQEYYKKTETYNKEEIDNKISLIPKFNIKVVDKLPTSNISEATVYLVKSGEESQNLYTEYIYTNGVWEQLGTQKLDLSGFYNKDEINSMLATRDSKITALEEENRSQADRIKELEEEVESLEADYKPNEISGETVTISDGRPKSKIKADINGNSYQETTEGYQAVDDSAIRNFTPTKGENYRMPFTPQKGEQYYFKLITDNPTVSTGNTVTITLYDLEGNSLGSISNTNNGAANNAVNTLYTATIDYDNVAYVGGYINYEAFSKAHKTIKGLLVSKTNSEILEPYTNGVATPNTNHKQDIEVIDGVNRLNPANANSSSTLINTLIEKTRYRLTSSVLENALIFRDIGFKKGTYTVSIQIVSGNYQGGNLVIRNSANTTIGEIAVKGTTTKLSLTVKDNDINSLVLWQVPAGTDIVYDIQIEKGDKSSAFLPYGHIGLVERKQGLFNGNFRQGGAYDKVKEDRLFSNQTLFFEKNKTYTILTNLEFSKYRYAVALATVDFPTGEIVYDSGWKLVRTFSFTPTTDGYFGIGVSKIDNTTIRPEEMANYYFIVGETENATDLEPIVHSIDLAGNSLAGIKNTDIKDNLLIGIDGSCEIKKNTGRDNLEKAYYGRIQDAYDTNRYRFNTNALIGKIKPDTLMLCNRFRGSLEYQNLWVDSYVINPSSGTISFYKNGIKTLEEWNAWVSENELDVLYELLNPQTIPLPSIEPIELFEGTNIFELVTNLGTTMKVEYKVSNKSRLEALEQAFLLKA